MDEKVRPGAGSGLARDEDWQADMPRRCSPQPELLVQFMPPRRIDPEAVGEPV